MASRCATWEDAERCADRSSHTVNYASPGAPPVPLSNVIRFGKGKPAGSG
jgi:hypothetical protein